MSGPLIYTLKEAAAILKVCSKTMHRLVESGKVRAFRVGRQWRIRSTDMEKFLAGGAA